MKRYLAPALAIAGIICLAAAVTLSLIRSSAGPAVTETASASTAVASPLSTPVIVQSAAAPSQTPAASAGGTTVALPANSAAALPSDEPAEAASAPASAAPQAELPVHLQIDAIGLNTNVVPTGVVNGVWQVADFAAGYMRGTGLPGRPGNVAVAGHDDIQGEVFRHLKSVKMGDAIVLDTPTHDYRYVVDSIRYVNPEDTSVIGPSPTARLTLITCWPDFITPRAAYNSLRLIVGARLAA